MEALEFFEIDVPGPNAQALPLAETMQLTDADKDTILMLVSRGESMSSISERFRLPITKFKEVLKEEPGFLVEIKEAKLIAAENFAYKAERVLKDAMPEREELSRAKELATHYRWMASKIDPNTFGQAQNKAVAASQVTFIFGDKQLTTTSMANVIQTLPSPETGEEDV